MANTTPIVTTITKTANKENTPKEADAALKANILDFCEEHYEDILPVIMDKIRRDKRKEVHARLDFGGNPTKSQRVREDSQNSSDGGNPTKSQRVRKDSQNSSDGTLPARYRDPSERPKMQDLLKYNDEDVFDWMGHRRQSAFDRLSNTYSPTKFGPNEGYSRDRSHSRGCSRRWSFSSRDCPRNRNRPCGIEESYGNTRSSYRAGDRHGYHARNRNCSSSMKRERESESPLSRVSESGTSDGGHRKTRAKRRKSADEEDLFVPWTCEDVDPFTPRMPNNVKTYDGTGDPKDHLKIFQAAAQVERWAMPTWCHMFNSTLIAATRQKKYVKDPVEIHNIKLRDGETIEEFMERFKIENGRMKGAPERIRISGFMHGVNNPELKKRLNEHVANTLEEMMTATTTFIRGETRVTRQKVTQSFAHVKEITYPPLTTNKETGGPLVIEAEIGGHAVQLIYVDGGSSMEVLYEHCFNRLRPKIKSQMVPATTSLTGFSEETIWPLGQLRLLVTKRDAEHYTKAWMNFMIVRSPSPYNGIIGRHGIREIQAVPSTAHRMLKFLVNSRIVTIRSTILTPTECATIAETPKDTAKKAEARHEKFKVAIHPDFLDQEITTGGAVSTKARTKLCTFLKGNLDIFAWQPSDMTGVPRSIFEHRLDIREEYSHVRQKKGGRPRRLGARQGNPSRCTKTDRGRNSARSILSRLVIQPGHSEEALW
nr:reverse transcriptase domain-containing protein [Tanacetum cinerariifolium]